MVLRLVQQVLNGCADEPDGACVRLVPRVPWRLLVLLGAALPGLASRLLGPGPPQPQPRLPCGFGPVVQRTMVVIHGALAGALIARSFAVTRACTRYRKGTGYVAWINFIRQVRFSQNDSQNESSLKNHLDSNLFFAKSKMLMQQGPGKYLRCITSRQIPFAIGFGQNSP